MTDEHYKNITSRRVAPPFTCKVTVNTDDSTADEFEVVIEPDNCYEPDFDKVTFTGVSIIVVCDGGNSVFTPNLSSLEFIQFMGFLASFP